eukprot:scaffold58195_cov72-Phaeocystis_antarctica.AAC.1
MLTPALGRRAAAGALCGLRRSVGTPAASSVSSQQGRSHAATSASTLARTTCVSSALCAMRAMPAASSLACACAARRSRRSCRTACWTGELAPASSAPAAHWTGRLRTVGWGWYEVRAGYRREGREHELPMKVV